MSANAVDDFSLSDNPNGAWSYSYSLGDGLIPLTGQTFPAAGVGGWWSGGDVPFWYTVAGNTSGMTASFETIVQPPNYLDMDPESAARVDTVYTVPSAGTYSITGDFLGIDIFENSHPVAILVNGTDDYSATIAAYDQSQAFNLTVTLTAGSTVDFAVETGATYTNLSTGLAATISAMCFLAGTLIAGPDGETPVERLSVGDMICTASGEIRPIVWIGKGRVLAARGRRNAATPVIVRKGALGENVPHHDLRVTKGHSFYFDEVLIPAEFLVNDRSVLWDDHAQEFTLYHIELGTHDVLLANGAPAESYRDDGNRWLFQNANSGWGLPPREPCAPVLTGGPLVDRVWRRLLERAGPRPGLPATDDPDLHLVVDGRRTDAVSRDGMTHRFRVAARPASVRIVSRAAVPAQLGVGRDPRSLGVAVRHIMVCQGRRIRTILADDVRLTEGFHGFERDNAIRWTDGDAAVPEVLFDDFDGPMVVALRLGGRTTYVDDGGRSLVA